MTGRRLYLEPSLWNDRHALQDKQKKYLVDVLRLKAGSTIDVFDGQGYCCEAELCSDDGVWVLVLGQRKRVAQSMPTVWLGCAIIKGKAFDDVIRMVSEIGVDTVFPLSTSRVVPQFDASRAEARIARWTKIATESARQSGRTKVMSIEPIRDFADAIRIPHPGEGIILHPEGESSLRQRLNETGDQARFVLIGPEGGFSQQEVEQAGQHGFCVCSLGGGILRARTAMVVAAAFACLGLTR